MQILADLEGVPYKTMYQRIKWHERQDGKKYMPEMKTKKKKKAEAEKVGREIVEGLPKFEADTEEKQDIPEDVYTGIPPYSCLTCAHRGFNDYSYEFVCLNNHEYCEGRGCCSDYKEKTIERKLMPETIEEIMTMYKQCCELADRYTKQAEDWARIMDVMQMEERERIRRT